ncbi:MAG: tyrosine--tRNA ligase [Gammaproteobacteria bacterium]
MKAPAQQLQLLMRGCEESLPEGELERKLAEGRPLRIKAGFDPTAPDLHLGHTVLMQKMRHFQEMGHIVIFLIGDYTARIGDPSGRNTARPPMTPQEIDNNAETYFAQMAKILNAEQTEVRRNSEWFGKMTAADMLMLAGRYTVARLLERDDFSRRMRQNAPISVREMLYPLMQGYDSVALNADVELGGSDQKFNLLVGRELQRQEGKPAQCILTMPLLRGLDGARKMSKSYGNHIGISEPAAQLYGKTMSASDDLMWEYYQLLSAQPADAIKKMKQQTAGGENPVIYKRQLAHELTARFCGENAAIAAAEEFQTIASGGAPAKVAEVVVYADDGGMSPPLFYLLKDARLVPSSSEGRRLIAQGAVKIDGNTEKDGERKLPKDTAALVQVGKRRFARIVVKQTGG